MKYDNKVLFILFYFYIIKLLLLGVIFYFCFIFVMLIFWLIVYGRNVCIMVRVNILKYIIVGWLYMYIFYM